MGGILDAGIEPPFPPTFISNLSNTRTYSVPAADCHTPYTEPCPAVLCPVCVPCGSSVHGSPSQVAGGPLLTACWLLLEVPATPQLSTETVKSVGCRARRAASCQSRHVAATTITTTTTSHPWREHRLLLLSPAQASLRRRDVNGILLVVVRGIGKGLYRAKPHQQQQQQQQQDSAMERLRLRV